MKWKRYHRYRTEIDPYIYSQLIFNRLFAGFQFPILTFTIYAKINLNNTDLKCKS